MNAASATRRTAVRGHRAPPCAMVIFGASGDLTRRLLMPALYNLVEPGGFRNFAMIGVDRSMADERFRTIWPKASAASSRTPANGDGGRAVRRKAGRFSLCMTLVDGDVTDPDTLRTTCQESRRGRGEYRTGGNVIFYLAVASALFGPIVESSAKPG